MEVLKINFCDFWVHFNKYDNYFTKLLSKYFKFEISNNPDFIIYSCYGVEFLKYDCYKVFYNGENLRINWNACDFAFGFDYIDNHRYFRLPNWIWYAEPSELLKLDNSSNQISKKNGFCSFVVSNSQAQKRIKFFHKLSKYKKVDSGGRFLNNIGGQVSDKLKFISQYKFNIAFENSSYPGYTTEKLFEPLLVNTIPIYWGNPLVNRDFNEKAFINSNDFDNEDELIEKIIELDINDDLYNNMLNECAFYGNKLPDCVNENLIFLQFEKIFNSIDNIPPVASTYRKRIHQIQIGFTKLDFLLNSKIGYRKYFR
jgi:hypothetical protein